MTTFNLRTRDGWLFLTTDVFPDSFHDYCEDTNWRCSKHTTLTIETRLRITTQEQIENDEHTQQ